MTRAIACLLLGFLWLLSSVGSAAPKTCLSLYLLPPPTQASPAQLLPHYRDEIRELSSSEIGALNRKMFEKLAATKPSPQAGRAPSISFEQAWDVLDSIRSHPTLNPDMVKAYERPDVSIGYCFGRAMYYHLLLLRMGLQKESIRKIWIVGDLRSGRGPDAVKWDYHVATIVYTTRNGWMALDPNQKRPQSIDQWAKIYSEGSMDSRYRFYVTDPSKQSIDIGKYNRDELGLDLSREEDWFKGYFADLLHVNKNMSLSTLGVTELQRLPKDFVEGASPLPTVEEQRKPWGFFRDFIGI